MTAKEFLQQVFQAYQDADSKIEQMARIQSLATRTTTVIHDTPIGNSAGLGSRVEQAIETMAEQSGQIADEIQRLLIIREEVASAIAGVSNPAERRVLEYRYLAFLSWKEISHSMKMALRSVYKLHERALENFSVEGTKMH